MHSTNYANAFISVAGDCPATEGTVPPKAGTIAAMQYELLAEVPYRWTSDDLIFEVHARRGAIAETDRPAARDALFAKPQPCLRASPLVRRYGWGLHYDADARIALVGRDTADYARLRNDASLEQRAGMRSKRAG